MSFLASCGSGPRYRTEGPTLDALSALSRQGPHQATRPLAQLTDFAWERVHYFPEGTAKRDIDAALGTPLMGDEGYWSQPGPLLVFVHEGAVVESIAALPPLHMAGPTGPLTAAEATVRVHGKGPPHLLKLEAAPR